MADRQEQVLDAAIRVLGTRGLRQLTHRAVDTEAGLPLGSTSNLFRTRDALIDGILLRLVQVETTAWHTLGADLPPGDVAAFTLVTGRLLRDLTREGRVIVLARYALFIEAAFHPRLRERIGTARRELEHWGVPLMAALGVPDPVAGFGMLLSLIDGLLSNQLAHDDPTFDPETAIGTLLRGLLG
ncbi:TetR family transcriptional regulator [Micromonospora sp. CPCC 206060]|uniref:TetR/AcrR family transcriptional regulator n=1 Tax=Micromonospora sp. CPCC 206060 TaxID=3122406 RepID=UPI002FEE9996